MIGELRGHAIALQSEAAIMRRPVLAAPARRVLALSQLMANYLALLALLCQCAQESQ